MFCSGEEREAEEAKEDPKRISPKKIASIYLHVDHGAASLAS